MFGIKNSKISEFCGWYGMLALIIAYFLVTFAIIQPQGVVFQLLNLTGSLGLLIVAAAKKVTQSVILNVFWIVIGVIAISRLFV